MSNTFLVISIASVALGVTHIIYVRCLHKQIRLYLSVNWVPGIILSFVGPALMLFSSAQHIGLGISLLSMASFAVTTTIDQSIDQSQSAWKK